MGGRPLREAVGPAYLFLCLLLGGSAQGIWVNMILQLLAVAIITWAAITAAPEIRTPAARRLLLCIALGLGLLLMHLIPLPPWLWTQLPGRESLVGGYEILGQALPWLPLSVTPGETVTTITRILPPLAIIAALLRLDAYRPSWLAWALVAGTAAGVLLGALQVTSAAGPASLWYLYPITNYGVATGFFANGNHMANLLVVTMPFLFALLAVSGQDAGKKALQRRSALFALIGGMLVLVLLGLILNGSLAGMGLGLPVLLASILLLLRPEQQRRWLLAPALLLVVAVGVVFTLPLSSTLRSYGADTSVESRRAVASTSWEAARDFMPLGSGIGSFEKVYRLYENPGTVDRTYVNHAHNDYLETVFEAGIPGAIAMLLFLAWWASTAWNRWRGGVGDPYARAAVIASAAILAHSLVDFPLRTSAIAAIFAMSLALMAQSKRPAADNGRPDLWPSRHLEVR